MNRNAIRFLLALVLGASAWIGWTYFEDAVDALTRGAFPKVVALSNKAEFYARFTFAIGLIGLSFAAHLGAGLTARMQHRSFSLLHWFQNLVVGFTVFLGAALIIKARSKGTMSFTGEMISLLKDNKAYILFNPLNSSAMIGSSSTIFAGIIAGSGDKKPKKRKSSKKARR